MQSNTHPDTPRPVRRFTSVPPKGVAMPKPARVACALWPPHPPTPEITKVGEGDEDAELVMAFAMAALKRVRFANDL
jgi:hypothetical protein